MSKSNDSFICTSCKKRHFFGVYVAAHADEELMHTCDSCGAVHSVLQYVVTLEKPGQLAERPAEQPCAAS